MRLHIHLDPLGGIAGDMFLAAVLDARPDLTESTLAAIRAAGLPGHWSIEVSRQLVGGLTGRRFAVHDDDGQAGLHGSTPFAEIRRRLTESALEGPVAARALSIFGLLAEAEGKVHGKAPEEVTFHEVAEWDSVADIVGAAHLIEALSGATWSVSPLPLGSGRVEAAHGALPVPAPATVCLLEGFETHDDGLSGERVTPTGAAILRHLSPARQRPRRAMRLAGSGTGFGTRELPGVPNLLRVLIFEDVAGEGDATDATEVCVVAFEVDDQTPEDLAVGIEHLRRRDGILDVTQSPVFGKRGRLLSSVRLLVRPQALDQAIEACFLETTTLGLRWHRARRAVLERRTMAIGGGGEGVRVKVAARPGGGRTAKAEIGDLSGLSGGHAARTRARRRAEDEALEEEGQ